MNILKYVELIYCFVPQNETLCAQIVSILAFQTRWPKWLIFGVASKTDLFLFSTRLPTFLRKMVTRGIKPHAVEAKAFRDAIVAVHLDKVKLRCVSNKYSVPKRQVDDALYNGNTAEA